MEKKPFPYNPFSDSLLGEVFWKTVEPEIKNPKTLLDHLCRTLNCDESAIVFTPNAIKQTLMVDIPQSLRKTIEVGNSEEISQKFLEVTKQTLGHPPRVDICMELLEWLFTGFSLDESITTILEVLYGKKLSSEQFQRMRNHYEEELKNPG